MKNSPATRNLRRLLTFCAVLCALAALPLLSSARPATTSVNIVNNSNREIRHVYLSRVDVDDWSGDKLNGTAIAPGQSATVSNFSCDSQQIKVIGEDQDGCFVSTVVACGSNASWTITNETVADCGH
ncbi:MAG TPA: hypothetical protein VJT09_18950 [Pyrinomonadaceae bacterium]|nr:hypothetical protein [Pyrinomonadaceae bacterium]